MIMEGNVKTNLSTAQPCAVASRRTGFSVATSYTSIELSADPLMIRLPPAAKCRLLQESECPENETVSRGVAPEQSRTLIPPLMRPAATSFWVGWKLQSWNKGALSMLSGLQFLIDIESKEVG